MQRFAAVLAIGMTAFLALPAGAETITQGPVTLDVPAGWKVIETKPKSLVIQSTAEEDLIDRANVMIYFQTSPPNRFEQSLNEIAVGIAKEKPDPKHVTTGRTADGLLAKDVSVSNRIKAGKPGKEREMRVRAKIAAVQGKTQFVGCALVTFSSSGWKHEKNYEALVRSLKVKDDPAATAPPPTKQDISGLYGKFGIMNQLNPMGGMDLVATRDYLYFQPGGFVFRDLPPADQINKPDLAKLRKDHPGDCGTYSYDGTKLTLSFANDYGFFEDETDPLTLEDKGLKLDKTFHQKLGPEKDRKLNGKFRYFFYSGGNGSTGTTGGVSSEKFLTLRPDGTYESQGMTGIAMTVEGGGSSTGIAGTSDHKPESGTYKIDGYTITFNPAGGPQKVATFYATDADGMIVINDTPYLNQDKKK